MQRFRINRKFSFKCVSDAIVRKLWKTCAQKKLQVERFLAAYRKARTSVFQNLKTLLTKLLKTKSFKIPWITVCSITTVYKKPEQSDKANNRPVSILWTQFMNTLKPFSLNFHVAFVRLIPRDMLFCLIVLWIYPTHTKFMTVICLIIC